MTLPVPPKFSPKERAAYLAGYRQAHRERIGDLRRTRGQFPGRDRAVQKRTC